MESISQHPIENKIVTVRGFQVMLDSDLASLYGSETKFINRAVKRNPLRFPESFVFQLKQKEWDDLRFHFGALEKDDDLRFQTDALKTGRGRHRKYLPYVFTEQGVAMLSSVLNTEIAEPTKNPTMSLTATKTTFQKCRLISPLSIFRLMHICTKSFQSYKLTNHHEPTHRNPQNKI